jgi:hypothetical protein
VVSSRAVLDQVYSLARIEALEADPGAYASAVAAEIAPAGSLAELEARDHQLAVALAQIDTAMTRVMRVRLDHALASDTSIAPPTRTVFASTIGKYTHDLPLLAQRVCEQATRGGATDPEDVAITVVDAARRTLALREALRAPALALIRSLATATRPDIERNAMDRERSDAERKKWSALRRDVETVIATPTHVSSAPLATRLAALPEQIDEPPPGPEVTFADMIELD